MRESSGKSMGGKARAKKLTPEERQKIAKKGAEARWGEQIPQATHKGILQLGDIQLPCFVLDDGRRVLSGRGITTAIGMKGRGPGVSRIASHRLMQASDTEELIVTLNSPIKFLGGSPKMGVPSDGFEATVLQELCEAILLARDKGLLSTPQEQRYGQFADAWMRSFARIGVIALVDEATGYQEVRPRDALQELLAQILRKELAAWTKRFPDEFFENIYKLKGWKWPGMQKNRYSIVGTYIKDLIYERLAPGVLEELEERNPKNSRGNRKGKHHQLLTEDIGHPLLSQHMQTILTLQRLAIAQGHGWTRFLRSVDMVTPKKGSQLQLELPLGT